MHCLIVGAGSIADASADGLGESRLDPAGVCDLDADRAEALAARLECPSFTDLDAALSAVEAPLVVNLTSHRAHAPVTRAALSAGRHVYSQKPLALSTETAIDLVETAEDHDLALGCAPESPRGPSQRRAAGLLADGRLGAVRLGYAHAHVGRVTDWHDRPESFLEIGPLYDGGVYPLTLLVSWFGPVERVRVADALSPWPERESRRPSAPSHIEATLSFADGPTVRLTASFYAPHRAREFYGLELHGDDGSLYLEGSGAMSTDEDDVQFGRIGREYTTVSPQWPTEPVRYADGPDRLAASVEAGSPERRTGRRGAHVVAICNAIETAADASGPIDVAGVGATADRRVAPVAAAPGSGGHPSRRGTLCLPSIGFGCSRYRDGTYVDRRESIATALDAGYRLFDSAELYGNEHRVGDLLAAPGAPDREGVFIIGKVWRTNHRPEHLLAACKGSLAELGLDAFDCYMLHWPGAWAHRGPLERLAERPVAEAERLAFPETDDGEPETAPIPLAEAWENLERTHERGWARTLGLCNVSREQLATVLEAGTIDPALVEVERHPYRPRSELVSFCHDRGIRVVAHAPLSAPDLLEEPLLAEIGAEYGLSPAGVVVAWNRSDGVVPIPSSTTTEHIVENLAAGATRLSGRDRERVASLCDPSFER